MLQIAIGAYFSGVRLVLLERRVANETHVVVHVEREERPALPARAHYNQLVKRVVLRQDHVLFDEHKLFGGGAAQLAELTP